MAKCESFNDLFDKARLRTTEVAVILDVHRVQVSRWKHQGLENCLPENLKRINNLIKLVDIAMRKRLLPIDRIEIVGPKARLAYLNRVLVAIASSKKH